MDEPRASTHRPAAGAQRGSLEELHDHLRALVSSGESVGVGLFLIEIGKAWGPELRPEQIEEVGWILSRALRQGDRIAHFDGGTFAVLLTGLTDREDARVVAARALDALPAAEGPWAVRFGLGLLRAAFGAPEQAWAQAQGELRDTRMSWAPERQDTLRVRGAR